MQSAFQRDCLDILAEKAARGQISRRRFAQLAGMLLAGATGLRATGAAAAVNELVLVNWGGDALKAYDAAFGKPFFKDTGITVKEDGSGPTEGAITAQFKSGKPSWDLVDADPFSAITLGKQGMIEPIDYSVVEKAKMRPGFGWDYAASTYFFSYVIAYDSKKYGSMVPTGMADFFDVKKFPGKRSMYKWGSGMWEAALLADGITPDKLYPLDTKRALDKIKAFKEHVVSFWGGGAASQSGTDERRCLDGARLVHPRGTDRAGHQRADQIRLGPGAAVAGRAGGHQGKSGRRRERHEVHRQHARPEAPARDVRHVAPGPGQPGHRRADPGG